MSASWSPVGASGRCVVVVVFSAVAARGVTQLAVDNGGASGPCIALLSVVACGVWRCWVVVVHRYFAHRWVAAGGVAQLAK